MKKSFARILAGLVIVGAVLLLNPTSKSRPTAVLAETEGCRLTSLSGTYGFAFSGYFNTGSSASPAYTPIAAAGTFTFHPAGTLTRSFNISFGGTSFSGDESGNYSPAYH